MKHSDINDWRKKWRKNPFVAFFTSLRLTVTLLSFSMALVFFGTLDQVNIGINKAQKDYFESFGAVWKYPEEWPLGTKMVLVTHPESDLVKNNEQIAIDDQRLKDVRFLGFIDNTFHGQIKSVFEDSEGALEPDPNLRFHTLKELKKTLVNDKYKNGHAAILPDSAIEKYLFEAEVGDFPAHLLQANNAGEAIRIFVIKLAGKTWVFKLKGNARLAGREQENFDEFVESIDIKSGQEQDKWDIPDGWKPGKESPMRMGSFAVKDNNESKLDISVTVIPGDMGGLTPNVKRWLGQIGLDPEPAVIPIEGQMPFTLRGLPVPLPGGYLLGGLLLINLLASATFRYQLKLRHAGIWITHGGLALMLISELVTDLTDKESVMVLDEGQSANYSKDFHLDEFALIAESDPDADHVMSIPIDRLEPVGDKHTDFPTIDLSQEDQRFPFVLKVKNFYRNTDFRSPENEGEKRFEVRKPNDRKVEIIPIAVEETFRADEMNFRSAVVELSGKNEPEEPIGEWLASSFFDIAGYRPQRFEHNGKKYRIEIRRKRYYYNFYIKLLDFRFLRYPGTDRPKDYSSDVKIDVPGEPPRKTRIYMNHPLNLEGNTFFQAGFDSGTEKQTRLQVVYNPGSMLPYIGVTMVGLGLAIQFLYHLFSFVKRRKVLS
jgi:hypothetical protein